MLLNVDAGEGAGQDESLVPLADLVNIACGAHAGDAATMEKTLRLAAASNTRPGAHPGYEDRANFGRLSMHLAIADAVDLIVRQIDALQARASSMAMRLWHVKLHGAVYHDADQRPDLAAAVATMLADRFPELRWIGPPGGESERAAATMGRIFLREGFADRAYGADGKLLDRRLPGALIADPQLALAQAVALRGKVDTLCVHGDSPHAVEILRALRDGDMHGQDRSRGYR